MQKSNKNIYVLDWSRDHLDFPEQLKLVSSQYNRWKPLIVGVESTAYQAALSQQLLSTRAYPIKQLKPTSDKTTRFMSRFTLFENGKVFLPHGHHLLGEFENEFSVYPQVKHDDLLDATEIALSMISHHNLYNPTSKHAYYNPDMVRRRKEINDLKSNYKGVNVSDRVLFTVELTKLF